MATGLDADDLHLAAIAEFQQGNAPLALDLIARAIAARPDDPRQHQSRGLMLKAGGRPDEAQAEFRRALALDAGFPEALASLGCALLEAGQAAAAREHLARAVARRPNEAEWHYNFALAQAQGADLAAAISSLEHALALRPGFARARSALGSLLFERGDLQGALQAFAGALRDDPSMSEAHNNLANVLLAQGRPADAEASLRAAIALKPAHSHAWNNLGNALRRQGRLAEAEAAFRAAGEREPALAVAWANRGNVLRELDRIEDASECFRQAIALQPDLPEAHVCAAICHLLAGDLPQGWDRYRWRHGRAPEPVSGDRLLGHARHGGRVELAGEQGLGDILFFLRWAPILKSRGARLAFRGDARLVALLAPTGLFDDFAAATAPAGDAMQVWIGDLPSLMGNAAPPHPPPLALHAPAAAQENARRMLAQAGAPPYIGVAWKSGVESASAEHLLKSVPVRALGAALRPLAATFVSLQRDPSSADTAALGEALGRGLVDRSGLNADLEGMLALLAVLDDYVGVSSTNVHMLAGLGRQARILVPSPPEWRYGRSGKESPWFPRFGLYREDREAGWAGAFTALERDLRRDYRGR